MRIDLSKTALKALQKMDAKQRERIILSLQALPQGDVKPMAGKPEGRYRLRVGGYRVIYRAEGEEIHVLDVGARGGIYK